MKNTVIMLAVVAVLPFSMAIAHNAEDIVRDSGVKGPLTVHLACRDGELAAALKRNERCLAHGLTLTGVGQGDWGTSVVRPQILMENGRPVWLYTPSNICLFGRDYSDCRVFQDKDG